MPDPQPQVPPYPLYPVPYTLDQYLLPRSPHTLSTLDPLYPVSCTLYRALIGRESDPSGKTGRTNRPDLNNGCLSPTRYRLWQVKPLRSEMFYLGLPAGGVQEKRARAVLARLVHPIGEACPVVTHRAARHSRGCLPRNTAGEALPLLQEFHEWLRGTVGCMQCHKMRFDWIRCSNPRRLNNIQKWTRFYADRLFVRLRTIPAGFLSVVLLRHQTGTKSEQQRQYSRALMRGFCSV